jgi:hypothetical protein
VSYAQAKQLHRRGQISQTQVEKMLGINGAKAIDGTYDEEDKTLGDLLSADHIDAAGHQRTKPRAFRPSEKDFGPNVGAGHIDMGVNRRQFPRESRMTGRAPGSPRLGGFNTNWYSAGPERARG